MDMRPTKGAHAYNLVTVAGAGGRKAEGLGPALQGNPPFPGVPWWPISCSPGMGLCLPWDTEAQEEGERAGSLLV